MKTASLAGWKTKSGLPGSIEEFLSKRKPDLDKAARNIRSGVVPVLDVFCLQIEALLDDALRPLKRGYLLAIATLGKSLV